MKDSSRSTERDGIIIGLIQRVPGTAFRVKLSGPLRVRSRRGDLATAWGEAWPPEDNSANLADGSSAIVTGRILNGYPTVRLSVPKLVSSPLTREVFMILGATSQSG